MQAAFSGCVEKGDGERSLFTTEESDFLVCLAGYSHLVLLMGAILLLIGVFLTASHWWRKVSWTQITYNGKTSANSSLYRSRDGKLLIHLVDGDEENLFIVDIDAQKVGMPNRSSFFILPGYAFGKDAPPLVVYMNSAKAEGKPELIMHDTFIDFTTTNGGRLRVVW